MVYLVTQKIAQDSTPVTMVNESIRFIILFSENCLLILKCKFLNVIFVNVKM